MSRNSESLKPEVSAHSHILNNQIFIIFGTSDL